MSIEETTIFIPRECLFIMPNQMTRDEMISRLAGGSDPISVSIEKYQMFKKWCEYQINTGKCEDIIDYAEWQGGTCALCYIHKECSDCELYKIKQECCPEKCITSPWRRVKYACIFLDESEDRQLELYAAIDGMIDVLNKCKEIE